MAAALGTPVRAGAEVEAAVFRAAQEALSNVAKHAQAGRVQLTLSYAGDTLLDLADDGTGFDPAAAGPAAAGGYGLTGMEQRLGRVGGTLTIESVPSWGTTINAAVPLAGRPSVPLAGPGSPTGEPRMGGVEAITKLRQLGHPARVLIPHHLRHRPRRGPRPRSGCHRLPAQGRSAR